MVHLTRRRLRFAVGLLWLLDAGLQAQPHLFSADWWHNDLAESVMGQPAGVSQTILWATGLLSTYPVLANSAAIAIQTAIGLCLITGRAERAAITISLPWALAVWWIGEGFGALPTGFARLAGGAPGPVLFYPLIAGLAWPHKSQGEDRPEIGPSPIATRAAWMAVWVGGAVLEFPWRVGAAQALRANIEQNSLDQPPWLTDISGDVYHALGAHPLLIPTGLLLVEVAVGLGVLGGRTRPAALAVGCALALLFWVAAQSLGGLATGTATDPGSGPLLVLLALTVASAAPNPESTRPMAVTRIWGDVVTAASYRRRARRFLTSGRAWARPPAPSNPVHELPRRVATRATAGPSESPQTSRPAAAAKPSASG